MTLLITFIILNILNVIIQTVKSIMTIKCGKTLAAISNAVAYGLYTVVLVYMSCDLTTLEKALIVGGCNLVGVYIVKSLEEKTNKDKLWKIEMTCPIGYTEDIIHALETNKLSFNTYDIDTEYFGINVYAPTQAESEKVKKIVDRFDVKYFVIESKVL